MGNMTKRTSSALVRPASNEREEATSCETAEHGNTSGDQQQRRVLHKIRYKRLDTGNLQEAIFNKYYIVKFNEQTKRQVNPYAVINKIEELSGSQSQAITAYHSPLKSIVQIKVKKLQGYKKSRGSRAK